VWSVVVALSVWWLSRSGGAEGGGQGWFVRGGDSAGASLQESLRNWFKLAHLNFHWIYPWALLAPYVVWLAWRFHLERERLRFSLPVHVVACFLFAVASHAINSSLSKRMGTVVVVTSYERLTVQDPVPGSKTTAPIVRWEFSESRTGPLMEGERAARMLSNLTNRLGEVSVSSTNPAITAALLTNVVRSLHQAGKPTLESSRMPPPRPFPRALDLLAYCSLVGLTHTVHFYRRYRDRERRTLQLESTLARARLHALQAQLHPHLLFNTLNAIATLLRRDARAAEATITSLSELLRLALSRSDQQEVTLREELEFLERYVEIQQTRFGDRLRFERQIEPAALECFVPVLLLQPLVENAIRHGIEPSPNPGRVRITARRQDARLLLSVEDDGVGLSSMGRSKNNTGIGLANLRERLQSLYADGQTLELLSRPEGGVAVRISIPWHVTPLPEAAGAGLKP
jgi:two-component sensor histidine kinase